MMTDDRCEGLTCYLMSHACASSSHSVDSVVMASLVFRMNIVLAEA
ncbi:hypothetical protein ACP70R_035954 [Stipagrostis hirtigluma subsp. patula]